MGVLLYGPHRFAAFLRAPIGDTMGFFAVLGAPGRSMNTLVGPAALHDLNISHYLGVIPGLYPALVHRDTRTGTGFLCAAEHL